MSCPLLACLLLAPVVLAQQPELLRLPTFGDAGSSLELPTTAPRSGSSVSGPSAAPLLLNRTAGLQMLEGELWAGADSYKVRFDAEGFQFTPALGLRRATTR